MREQASITRATNGWVVSISSGYYGTSKREVLCLEWAQVLALITERAHETPVGGKPDLSKPVDY